MFNYEEEYTKQDLIKAQKRLEKMKKEFHTTEDMDELIALSDAIYFQEQEIERIKFYV